MEYKLFNFQEQSFKEESDNFSALLTQIRHGINLETLSTVFCYHRLSGSDKYINTLAQFFKQPEFSNVDIFKDKGDAYEIIGASSVQFNPEKQKMLYLNEPLVLGYPEHALDEGHFNATVEQYLPTWSLEKFNSKKDKK